MKTDGSNIGAFGAIIEDDDGISCELVTGAGTDGGCASIKKSTTVVEDERRVSLGAGDDVEKGASEIGASAVVVVGGDVGPSNAETDIFDAG